MGNNIEGVSGKWHFIQPTLISAGQSMWGHQRNKPSKYQEKIFTGLRQFCSNLSAQISIFKLYVREKEREQGMGELMSHWELGEGLDKRLCVSFSHWEFLNEGGMPLASRGQSVWLLEREQEEREEQSYEEKRRR